MSAEDGYCSSGGSPPADSDEQAPPPPPSSPPPTKRSRRSVQKRVVSVPIGGGGGERPKGGGEGPPPSDSWAWRKYGQKPIKGSPYPRGYYRCSSSKGCPARKQVERSRHDPAVLLVTYSFDHNHPWPLPKSKAAPPPPPATEPEPEPEPDFGGLIEPELMAPAAAAASGGDEDGGFEWFVDQEAASTSAAEAMLYAPVFGALEAAPPLLPEEGEGEGGGLEGEDVGLFAGLGELPECAFVFGRRRELGLAATGPWCS